MTHKRSVVSALIIMLSMQGCALAPSALEPADRTPVPPDRLTVVAAPTIPKGIAGAASTSTVAEGAAGGALLGILMLPGAPLLAIAALPLIPLYTIAGAAGASAASSDEAEIAAHTLLPTSHQADLQGQLRDRVANILRQRSPAQPDSPQPAAERIPPAGSPGPKAVILQVGLREIGFTVAKGKGKGPVYALFVKPEAKILDADGKTVLDEMCFELRSPAHPRETWLDREHAPFDASMNTALDQAAERIVFEMVEVYYPKAPEEPARYSAPTPYYTLAPVYPEPTQGWIPGSYRPTQLSGDMNPTFRWQAFPRPIDLATVGGQDTRFANVRYDLRIFSVERRKESFGNTLHCFLSKGLGCDDTPLFALGAEIYRRDGLSVAEHRIETPLTPCAYYAWTVRARFTLDDRPRSTEWTSNYMFAPWKVRRGLLMPGEQSMQDRHLDWLLFRAPTPEGADACTD